MNKLYITDVKTVKRNITEVQALALMMHGIDYIKKDGITEFYVNYNDGYLFDIKSVIKRILE